MGSGTRVGDRLDVDGFQRHAAASGGSRFIAAAGHRCRDRRAPVLASEHRDVRESRLRRHRDPSRRRRRRSQAARPGVAHAKSADDGHRGVSDLHADARARRRRRTRARANNDEINVNSKEGQPISLDVSMSFELDPDKAPALYTTFRRDIDVDSAHGYVKQSIRQALQEVIGNEEIAAVIGPKKAEAVDSDAAAHRRNGWRRTASIVKQFTINELRAPPAVIEAINQKNVMQQQALTAQNELQKNTFQAQGDSIKAAGRAKAILTEAEAQATRERAAVAAASRRRSCSTRWRSAGTARCRRSADRRCR